MSSAFTILVVDDEKKERDGIETLIIKGNYNLRVLKANNGEDALSWLLSTKVDILLTDIKMPFLDGISLIHKIKDRKGEMFLILYSAYADFEYAQNAIALGVNKYLLKPIKIEDFHSILEEAIQWCEEREQQKADNIKIQKIIEDSKFYILEKQIQLLLTTGTRASKVEDTIRELVPLFNQSRYFPIIVCSEATAFIEVIEAVNRYSPKLHQFIYLLLDASTFLICLFVGNNDQDAGAFCDMLLKTSQQQYQTATFVIVGRPLDQLGGLKHEYEIMSTYADYFYFISSNTVVYVQNDAHIESSHDVIQISIEKISTCVKVKNYSEAYLELERLQFQIYNNRSYSQIFIKYILTEMIKKISKHTTFNMKPADFVNEIYSTDNLSKTMNVIENIIKKIEFNEYDNLDQNRIIRIVKEIVTQDYNNDVMGLAYLADKVQVTPAYLSALYKKETGQNISKFIADYRIEQAKYLLKTTHSKISEIGEQVGFQNSSYFISIFRSKENVSPAQYREREGN